MVVTNNKILISYQSHDLKKGQLISWPFEDRVFCPLFRCRLNYRPIINNCTGLDHLNTGLYCFSDPLLDVNFSKKLFFTISGKNSSAKIRLAPPFVWAFCDDSSCRETSLHCWPFLLISGETWTVWPDFGEIMQVKQCCLILVKICQWCWKNSDFTIAVSLEQTVLNSRLTVGIWILN